MIEIKGLYKTINRKQILADINLTIKKGSIFGLIGPNGAGKTTLIKCITGIWKADKGTIRVMEKDVFENIDVKQKMSYVSDENIYYNSFKVKDIIDFYRMTYENFNMDRYRALNSSFEIGDNTVIKHLSKGMKMKLSIMLTFSTMPDVIIMDEPTSGLDPIAKRNVLNTIVEEVVERKTTVLISSHNLNELERICDNIGMIENGKINFSSSLDDMKKNIKKLQVIFENKLPDDIRDWDDVIAISNIGRIYHIVVNDYSQSFERKLKDNGATFIEEIDVSLDDMFIYIAGGVNDGKQSINA